MKFTEGGIVYERFRGSHEIFQGQNVRGRSRDKYGWRLTHTVSGKTKLLAPSGGSGVGKKAAIMLGKSWAEIEELGRPPLMVQTKREEKKPVRELQVHDLWHLASAVAQTGECLKVARETEIVSSHHAEDVLETLTNDAQLQDGEAARERVLEVWHLAHSAMRALLGIEGKLHAILDLTAPGRVGNPSLEHDVRKLVSEALEGTSE